MPPKDLPTIPGKLDPSAFQTNFPQQPGSEPATVSAAFKTIKPEDFLSVTQGACARDGFLGGITTGAFVGGVRFVMRGRSTSRPDGAGATSPALQRVVCWLTCDIT